MRSKIFLVLFLLGFILRFAGLFFNGNQNYDSYREVGQWISGLGLADGFSPGYGPIAQLIMGVSNYFAQFTPHIWWFPYKAANFIFEIAILVLLLRLFKKYTLEIIFLYWLNPWFLIPGAWQGFWDAALGFFMLVAAFILDFRGSHKKNYFLAGLSLGIAFCIKPQAVAPISILGIYFLIFHVFRFQFKEVFSFVFGVSLLPLLFNFYFFLNAKSAFYFFQIYSNFASAMPNLVNSEINIWHTVTYIIMSYQHMKGPIYSLTTTIFPYNIMEKGAQFIYFLLLIIFIWKSRLDKTYKSNLFFTKAFAFPLILMPQILTRSHAYHFYAATLLLIPLIITGKNKWLFIFWVLSVFIHFYNIYYGYGLGQSIANPPHFLPMYGDPVISILGFIQFLVTLGLIFVFLS